MYSDFQDSDIFPLYFAYDGHWNKEGNKLASEIFYRELTKHYI
jgi:hypothetical protein